MAGSDRVLYIGTSGGMLGAPGSDSGLLELPFNGGPGEARSLGMENKGGIRTVIVDTDDPSRLYICTSSSGVWRTDDGGANWAQKNEGLTYKEVWSLVQHPTTGELYAGTGPAAMFKSEDRGETWRELRGMRMFASVRDWSFPGPPFLAHTKYIGLHKDDPQLLWGAVEEGWLVRSTDGGESWENIKDGTEFDSHTALPMPDDPSVVVSTAGTGVYRSKDGGDTFVDSQEGLERRYMIGFAVHPERPQRLFSGAAEVPPPFWRRPEGASGAIYRSDDQGESWNKITAGFPEWFHAAPRSIAIDPAEPDTVFVSVGDGSLWMSDDGGSSFRSVLEGMTGIGSITVSHR